MRQIVIVAHAHVVFVHATEPFQRFGHLDPISTLASLVLLLGLWRLLGAGLAGLLDLLSGDLALFVDDDDALGVGSKWKITSGAV